MASDQSKSISKHIAVQRRELVRLRLFVAAIRKADGLSTTYETSCEVRRVIREFDKDTT